MSESNNVLRQWLTTKNIIAFVIISTIALAPYLYFTIVGAKEVRAEDIQYGITRVKPTCTEASEQEGGISLGMWNLMYGSVNAGFIGSIILFVLCTGIYLGTNGEMFEVTLMVASLTCFMLLVIPLFNIIWPFYGVYLLSRHGVQQHCKETAPVIYWSTFAGIFYGFLIMIIFVTGVISFMIQKKEVD